MADVTLECRDVRKSYGGLHVLDGINVPFEAGKITALIGPNGAGKSTLFHLITGLDRPDAGRIYHRDQRIDGLAPWRIARRGVVRLFQDIRIFRHLTGLENILIGIPGQHGEAPAGSLFMPGVVRHEEREAEQRARRWLERLGLGEAADTPGDDLSYGQQKLLALGRSLAADADVLLLDEPTSGMNPETIRRLVPLLREAAGQGKTLVVIEHDMSYVLEEADWVYFLEDGQITAFGLPREVLDEPVIREKYLGL